MAQEKLAENIFDSVVQRYDKFLRSVTFGLIDKWQEILVKNTPAGKFPIDVGTGTGEVLKKIKQEYTDSLPIGIDVSLNMLKNAKSKNNDSLFLKASAYNLPFKNNCVTSIYMSLVFRHLKAENSLPEFSRVLSKGGHVGILDISKPSKLLFNTVFFFANKIFRPLGEKIFSKEEYDYFMESILNSRNPLELKKLFNSFGYKEIFMESYFLGLVVIAVFRKE